MLLVIAVCIVFSVFFTETLVLVESDHDCISEKESCRITEEEICRPCLQIEAAKNFLKTLKPAGVTAYLTPDLMFPIRFTENNSGYNAYLLSLIEQKVRFNT